MNSTSPSYLCTCVGQKQIEFGYHGKETSQGLWVSQISLLKMSTMRTSRAGYHESGQALWTKCQNSPGKQVRIQWYENIERTIALEERPFSRSIMPTWWIVRAAKTGEVRDKSWNTKSTLYCIPGLYLVPQWPVWKIKNDNEDQKRKKGDCTNMIYHTALLTRMVKSYVSDYYGQSMIFERIKRKANTRGKVNGCVLVLLGPGPW